MTFQRGLRRAVQRGRFPPFPRMPAARLLAALAAARAGVQFVLGGRRTAPAVGGSGMRWQPQAEREAQRALAIARQQNPLAPGGAEQHRLLLWGMGERPEQAIALQERHRLTAPGQEIDCESVGHQVGYL